LVARTPGSGTRLRVVWFLVGSVGAALSVNSQWKIFAGSAGAAFAQFISLLTCHCLFWNDPSYREFMSEYWVPMTSYWITRVVISGSVVGAVVLVATYLTDCMVHHYGQAVDMKDNQSIEPTVHGR